MSTSRVLTNQDFIDAVKTGKLELVTEYLSHQGAANTRDEDPESPTFQLPVLSIAAFYGQTEIARALIRANADINADKVPGKGITALFIAAINPDTELLRELLFVKGIARDTLHYTGYNALEIAALKGRVDNVKALIQAGAKVQREDFYQTLLQQQNNHEIVSLFNGLLAAILELDEALTINLAPEIKTICLRISARNLERVQHHIAQLRETNKLTCDALTEIIRQVTHSIPNVPAARNPVLHAIHPLSLGETQGNVGMVSKGYATPEALAAKLPDMLVKRYPAKINESIGLSKREVKSLLMLGRKASSELKPGAVEIMTEWVPGIDLATLGKLNPFSNFSIKQRLQWLATALPDINGLHAHYRIHGDLKLENLVVNPQTNIMRVIDLGSVKKAYSPKETGMTLANMDPSEGLPRRMTSDTYMFGLVIAQLFPEIFSVEFRPGPVTFLDNKPPFTFNANRSFVTKVKDSGYSPRESAIIALVDALMDPVMEHRCTSQQAMEYCQGLLQKFDELDQITTGDLAQVLETTLNRKQLTVDDLLRDSKRALLFADGADQQQHHLHLEAERVDKKATQAAIGIFKGDNKRHKPEAQHNNDGPEDLPPYRNE